MDFLLKSSTLKRVTGCKTLVRSLHIIIIIYETLDVEIHKNIESVKKTVDCLLFWTDKKEMFSIHICFSRLYCT